MFTLAGGDATDIFEDIGHSTAARKELKEHLIGTLKLTEEEQQDLKKAANANPKSLGGGGASYAPALFVVLLAISVGLYYLWLR